MDDQNQTAVPTAPVTQTTPTDMPAATAPVMTTAEPVMPATPAMGGAPDQTVAAAQSELNAALTGVGPTAPAPQAPVMTPPAATTEPVMPAMPVTPVMPAAPTEPAMPAMPAAPTMGTPAVGSPVPTENPDVTKAGA